MFFYRDRLHHARHGKLVQQGTTRTHTASCNSHMTCVAKRILPRTLNMGRAPEQGQASMCDDALVHKRHRSALHTSQSSTMRRRSALERPPTPRLRSECPSAPPPSRHSHCSATSTRSSAQTHDLRRRIDRARKLHFRKVSLRRRWRSSGRSTCAGPDRILCNRCKRLPAAPLRGFHPTNPWASGCATQTFVILQGRATIRADRDAEGDV